MSIPKIIHQTAMTDKSRWDPRWEGWSQTWKDKFPDWEYRMWNDEDIDTFMKEKYPAFYPQFRKWPHQIQRVDMWRYFALHYHGGMYVDMDFECFKNFESFLLPGKVTIAESPWKGISMASETYQNALMASPPQHPFWNLVFQDFQKQQNILCLPIINRKSVLQTTGPAMLTRCISKTNNESLNFLDHRFFSGVNGRFHSGEDMYAQHGGTSIWNDRYIRPSMA